MRSRTGLSCGLACLLLAGLGRTIQAQGYSPDEAPRRMTVFPGLEARMFAAEPMIRQPVAAEFDDRGRLWVIQYLQYPNPAGLSRVQVDRYSRTKYDRMPEPPPAGPKGSDRITILEDTDADGAADRARDFLTELNLASGLAFGDGGVYVLQAPYLLFYPDRDRDDVPDGDPEVLLTGFGMEDAHSVANSLTWGPDGWLYGLQGSTVTARIRGIEFQQGVWRYHPRTRRFELFSEGGGNMWGLDFDPFGRLFASTNVGGFVMLHAVQGGYYWKSFGKHGALHNPHTYGYFDHVPHQGVRGGHVAVGGQFYQADAFPEALRGKYLSADLLDHGAHWHEVSPRGTTFEARRGGYLLQANDTWFAPSDMTLGPDGALYLTDWHDRRTAHPDPDADWDRTNGRIVTLKAKDAKPAPDFDLETLTSAELVGRIDDPNVWFVRRARRLLAERRDPSVIPALNDRLATGQPTRTRLEALWALHGMGGLPAERLIALLEDPEPHVRGWAVRLLGDDFAERDDVGEALKHRAAEETDASVRAQLACTAQRLTPRAGLDVAARLLLRDLDAGDPHLPLLLWWAVERHALNDLDRTLARFAMRDAWSSGLTRATILPRLVRRFAAEVSPAGDGAVARLLESAPADELRAPLLAALEESTRSRPAKSFAPGLVALVRGDSRRAPADMTLTRLVVRMGDPEARGRILVDAADRLKPEAVRSALVELLGEIGDPDARALLGKLATNDPSDAVRRAALRSLGRQQDSSVATEILAAYPQAGVAWRATARDVLLGRPEWTQELLRAVDAGAIDPKEVPLDQVARVALHGQPELDSLVRKLWGTVAAATPEEKLAEVRRLNNDVRAAQGDPLRGRVLFGEKCASCHRLFDEGNAIGPELTHANRKDREFLLVSLVNPSGVIRKEYQSYVLEARDGRLLTGLVVEQSPDSLTLVDAKGQRTTIARADVAEIRESPTSLMPEGLYREFNPEQLRDLFGYLQGDGPTRTGE